MNLKWYDITTGISLVAFVFYIILVIVKTVFSPRETRIRFLRDFKINGVTFRLHRLLFYAIGNCRNSTLPFCIV